METLADFGVVAALNVDTSPPPSTARGTACTRWRRRCRWRRCSRCWRGRRVARAAPARRPQLRWPAAGGTLQRQRLAGGRAMAATAGCRRRARRRVRDADGPAAGVAARTWPPTSTCATGLTPPAASHSQDRRAGGRRRGTAARYALRAESRNWVRQLGRIATVGYAIPGRCWRSACSHRSPRSTTSCRPLRRGARHLGTAVVPAGHAAHDVRRLSRALPCRGHGAGRKRPRAHPRNLDEAATLLGAGSLARCGACTAAAARQPAGRRRARVRGPDEGTPIT